MYMYIYIYIRQIMGLARFWASKEGFCPSSPVSEMEQAEELVKEAFEERLILRQVVSHIAESACRETLLDVSEP